MKARMMIAITNNLNLARVTLRKEVDLPFLPTEETEFTLSPSLTGTMPDEVCFSVPANMLFVDFGTRDVPSGMLRISDELLKNGWTVHDDISESLPVQNGHNDESTCTGPAANCNDHVEAALGLPLGTWLVAPDVEEKPVSAWKRTCYWINKNKILVPVDCKTMDCHSFLVSAGEKGATVVNVAGKWYVDYNWLLVNYPMEYSRTRTMLDRINEYAEKQGLAQRLRQVQEQFELHA